MGINPLVDNAASQQVAVIGNLNIAQDLNRIQKDQDKGQKREQITTQNLAEKALSTSPSKLGIDLIADLAYNIASSGIKLEPANTAKKSSGKAKDEYDLMFASQDNVEDQADIKSAAYQLLAPKSAQRQKGQNRQKGDETAFTVDKETAETIKDYTTTYANYIINGSAELKRKLEVLEEKLAQKGVNPKELLSLQQNVKKSLRGEIASQIKEAYIQRFLTPKKGIDQIIKDSNLNQVLDLAFNNQRLGGKNFGGYNVNLQGTSDRVAEEAVKDLKDFAREEMETKLIQKQVGSSGQEKNFKDDFQELVKLGARVGVNLESFYSNWKKKQANLGLFLFTPPPPNSILAGGAQADTNSSSQQKSGYEFNAEDEKEVLMNRMRAIFMVRALKGDMLTMIETSFRMRKLKNGLIKLGYTIGDFEQLKEQVKQEGEALARMRCFEILKEAFAERATLYDLAGPAFKLIERKIKGALNNLEKLGVNLSTLEIDSFRDNANQEMFDISLEELQTTSMALKATPNPGLELKQQLILKLLNRLKEESGLTSTVPVVEGLGKRV
jgi:hypothetical protein